MTTSKGFGKPIKIRGKEKISLRQMVRQIYGLAKGKKHEGILQEYRRIKAASQAIQDLSGSNQVDGAA
ncbi:hypothetical protein HW132_36335, partial [Brasilonema sp. CT11]|nr:hypothetical protein [Brasilonema sp. CT11]